MQVFFWIAAILISLLVGYWVYRADKKRAVPYPWLTASLRSLVIFLTCLLLLAPLFNVSKNEIQKPIVLFLQDNSQSVPVALKSDTVTYRKNTTALLDKLRENYRVIQWGFGNTIQRDTLFDYRQHVTDISSALNQAVAYYGQQNLGAIILASDGRYNQGVNPQYQELGFNGSVYTVALGDSTVQKDIRIAHVYANKVVALNSHFEIRVDVVAEQCNGYNNSIRLTEVNGGSAGNAAFNVTSDRFDRAVSFTIKADKAGLHHYVITAPVADGESNTVNNRKDVFVEVVTEKKNILIAANAPHPDVHAIREALSGLEEYDVSVRTGDNLPTSFKDYQVVILHSLPSQNNLLPQLTNSNKAVWLIMGANSSHSAFNSLQHLARLNVNPFNLQNQFAAYNPSFSGFTLPQHVNAVMDKLPPLSVPAGTMESVPGAMVLFHARGNSEFPLWMLQQGTPSTALLLGEGLWRWRLFEYRHFNTHNVIDDAIRQTVSFLAANVNDKPFQVSLPKYIWSDQESISLNGQLLNANNEQVNTPDVNLVITDSAGRKQNYSLERFGTAYKLNIGLRAGGQYNYMATTVYNGTTYTASGSFLVQYMPFELTETGADYPLLYDVARKNKGVLVLGTNILSLYDTLKNNPDIKPVIQTTTETIPLIDWKWYFFVILAVAVAEWLLRKYWLAQ